MHHAAIMFWVFLGIIGWVMFHTFGAVLIFMAIGFGISLIMGFLNAIAL